MKFSLKPGPTAVTVVSAAAVISLVGAGGAVAGGLITSAQIKDNTILSRDVHDGTLTGADVHDGSLTGADVRDGSLTGADIKDGSLSNNDVSIYYATVNSDATIVDQSGGVTGIHLGTGNYAIDFHRNVTKCAFVATVGSPVNNDDQGQANVADRAGNVNAVFVNTRSNDGSTNADHGFHLVVVC